MFFITPFEHFFQKVPTAGTRHFAKNILLICGFHVELHHPDVDVSPHLK
jgi:hypothetical protein